MTEKDLTCKWIISNSSLKLYLVENGDYPYQEPIFTINHNIKYINSSYFPSFDISDIEKVITMVTNLNILKVNFFVFDGKEQHLYLNGDLVLSIEDVNTKFAKVKQIKKEHLLYCLFRLNDLIPLADI